MYFLRRLTVKSTNPVSMSIILGMILTESRTKARVLSRINQAFDNGQSDFDECFDGEEFPLVDAPDRLKLLAAWKVEMEVYWKEID